MFAHTTGLEGGVAGKVMRGGGEVTRRRINYADTNARVLFSRKVEFFFVVANYDGKFFQLERKGRPPFRTNGCPRNIELFHRIRRI